MELGQLTGVLGKKFAGIPGWGWLIGLGAGVYFVLPKLVGKKGSTTPGKSSPGYQPNVYLFPYGAPSTIADPNASFPTPAPPPVSPWHDAAGNPLTPEQIQKAQDLGYTPAVVQNFLPRIGGSDEGGVGGAAPRRRVSVGSRSSHAWNYFHPSMKQRVRYVHYVKSPVGVGGAAIPAAHIRSIHELARQTGIHPARLLALNPHHTGLLRIS
jgi:hypothetical protein